MRSFLTIDPFLLRSQVDSRAAVARQEVEADSRAGELVDEVVEEAHSEVEEAEEASKVCFSYFGPFLFACFGFGSAAEVRVPRAVVCIISIQQNSRKVPGGGGSAGLLSYISPDLASFRRTST